MVWGWHWVLLCLFLTQYDRSRVVLGKGNGTTSSSMGTMARVRRGVAHHYATSSKPLCTEMKRYPGHENGAFITRDPGVWKHQSDGSMIYDVSTCTLQRFTATEARQCFADRHLLMIGDSLMRYQYIGLVYFLEHGAWPSRFSMASTDKNSPVGHQCRHWDHSRRQPTCSPPGVPSVVSENDWAELYGHATDKSWRLMHQHLGGAGMNRHLECQCARAESDTSTEVMFFDHSFPRLSNELNRKESVEEDAMRVRVSFLSNLGEEKVHLWKRSYCEQTGQCNLTESQWYALQSKAKGKQWDYNAPLPEFIERYLPTVIPDVDTAVFNTGLWGGGTPYIKKVMKRLFALVHNESQSLTSKTRRLAKKSSDVGRCYWKNVSPAWTHDHLNGYPETFAALDNDNRKAAYGEGCGVFDISHVTKQFAPFQWFGDLGRASCCGEKEMMEVYFDAAHFRPWVNEEINNLFLNVLC